MYLNRLANLLERKLAPLTTVFGNIGASVIAVLMLLTVSDIIGRRFFNSPILGAYELSEFMLVIVVFFVLAHCEFRWCNVTIGLVVSRLRPKSQSIINSIMYVLFLGSSCILTWRLCLLAMREWQNNLISGNLNLPVFPFVLIAAFGCFLLSIVVFMHLLLFLSETLKK